MKRTTQSTSKRRPWGVLAATTVAAAGVTGIAGAAIPYGGGRIHGCYSAHANDRRRIPRRRV
ncbi:MAG: hypothetical protein M3071_24890 [Actinomycetota bacterium]|nr:hypothetical protein [Actinomycetota bacterium]